MLLGFSQTRLAVTRRRKLKFSFISSGNYFFEKSVKSRATYRFVNYFSRRLFHNFCNLPEFSVVFEKHKIRSKIFDTFSSWGACSGVLKREKSFSGEKSQVSTNSSKVEFLNNQN